LTRKWRLFVIQSPAMTSNRALIDVFPAPVIQLPIQYNCQPFTYSSKI
jgi:hypothetical protein